MTNQNSTHKEHASEIEAADHAKHPGAGATGNDHEGKPHAHSCMFIAFVFISAWFILFMASACAKAGEEMSVVMTSEQTALNFMIFPFGG